MTRRCATFIVIVALAGFASRARADGTDHEAARQHFDAARDAFLAGSRAAALREDERAKSEFRISVDEYIKSYDAEPQPETMFALGQAYRELGDLDRALHSYKQYLLEAPENGRWRKPAAKRVEEIEEALARKQAAEESPTRGVPLQPDGKATLVERSAKQDSLVQPSFIHQEHRRSPRKWYRSPTGWTLVGSGVAIALTGLGLVLHGNDLDGQVTSAASLSQAEDLQRGRDTFRTAGEVLLGVGGAALVSGGVVLIVRAVHHRGRE